MSKQAREGKSGINTLPSRNELNNKFKKKRMGGKATTNYNLKAAKQNVQMNPNLGKPRQNLPILRLIRSTHPEKDMGTETQLT
ncbi:hypothetical protein U1Q18_015521 [Sarracenia purpurea var. burkii]